MRFFLIALQVWDPAALSRLESPLRDALAIREKEVGRNSPAYAEAVSQFARFLVIQGRPGEARDWYRKALSIRESAADLEALAGLDPSDAVELLRRASELGSAPGFRSRLLRRLGSALEATGDRKGAGEAYEKALAAARGAAPADIGVAANDLGLFAENAGDMRRAESLYRQALASLEKAYGPRHPEVGTTLNNLAGAVGAQGRLPEAEALLRRALSTLESTVGRRHLRTAATAGNLGDLLAATGRAGEARRMFALAIEGYRAAGDGRAAEETAQRAAALAK